MSGEIGLNSANAMDSTMVFTLVAKNGAAPGP